MRRPLVSVAVLPLALAPLVDCARAPAPPPATSAAAPTPRSPDDDESAPLPPFPSFPPPPKTVDHPQPRAVTVIARHVSDGIETLIAATGPEISCRGSLPRGAEVRVDAPPGVPRPFSGW